MKYQVRITRKGKVIVDVMDHGQQECKDIVHVCQTFGSIKKVEEKDDDNPVFDRVNVNNK